MAAESEHPTSFLDLPPELRNVIYASALAEDDSNAKLGLHQDRVVIRTTYPHIKEPALMLVDRQIRREASSIFYGTHIFESFFATDINEFLRVCKVRCVLHLLDSVRCLSNYGLLWTKKFLRNKWSIYRGTGLKAEVMVVRVFVEGRGLVWLSRGKTRNYRVALVKIGHRKQEIIVPRDGGIDSFELIRL